MTDTSKRPVSPVNGQPLPRGKPFEPGEQQREISRKAGKRSAQVKKERKTLREELLMLLSEKQEDGRTGQASMSVSLLQQAIKGNVKAYEIIRDTIGEKPVENVNVNTPDKNVMDEVRAYLNGVEQK